MENRYDKYKDSGIAWIGEIPEHWKVRRMKSIYNFGKGLNITKADLVDKGIPVISYGQIHSKLNIGTCIKDSLIRYVPKVFLENNNTSLVKKGDVIFADTSEDLEGCGNCIYIDRDMLLYAGYHTIIAKNISTSYNRYFSYLFQTDCWRFQIRRMVNGVKLFSIPQKLLASTDVITPSTQEQQSITAYLDQKCGKIDELITVQEEIITKLQCYKQSVITEAVTKGLDKNVPLKDSGIEWIGEIPEHWKVKKLGHLYIPRNEKVSDQDYPALSVTMQGVLLQLENVAKTNDGDNRKLVKIGDFAINSRSDRRGSCGISKYDGSVSLINTVLIPINDMNPVFYEWLFHSSLFSDEYYRWGHGIVNDLWTTKWQEMKNIQIVAPPLQEQQSIATYLDQKCSEIDELISIKQQKIEKLKEYKKSLIFECVTGKRKVS